jgi:hypothetical protein
MPFIGSSPAEVALTTGDLGNNIVDGTKTKDALIGDYSDVTITASDLIMYGDATDSNNTKRDTVQGILDLASGGWQFVSSQTASSSATIAFTNMADGYDYEYVLEHVLPATDSVYMKIELGVAGPTYRTSTYLSGGHAIQQATSLGGNLTNAIHGPYSDETFGNGSGEGLQFAQLYLASPAVSSNQTCYRFVGEFMDESVRQVFFSGGGRYNSAEAHTSVKFAMNSGNIASGRFFQYRRARS